MSVIARPRTGEVVSVEPTVKRVRVMFGGETVADSHRALILFEQGHLPVYYFPLEDVRDGPARAVGQAHHLPAQGRGELLLGPRRATASPRTRSGTTRSRSRTAPTSRGTSPSTGTRWTRGGRRTTRSSSTRATRTTASTCCAARATSASSSTGRSSPRPTARCCSSRPACRRAGTSRAPTSASTSSRRPTRAARARTRASRSTGPRPSTARPRGHRLDLSGAVAECPKIEQAMCFFNEREAVTLTVDGEDVERPETHWSRRSRTAEAWGTRSGCCRGDRIARPLSSGPRRPARASRGPSSAWRCHTVCCGNGISMPSTRRPP